MKAIIALLIVLNSLLASAAFTYNGNLTGIYYGANIVVDNPIYPTYLLQTGRVGTGIPATLLYYALNRTVVSSDIVSVFSGSIAFADMNNDGKLEIIVSGSKQIQHYQLD